jgi:hypothetical protein
MTKMTFCGAFAPKMLTSGHLIILLELILKMFITNGVRCVGSRELW